MRGKIGRLTLDFRDQRLFVKVVERLKERGVPLKYRSPLVEDIVLSDHLEAEEGGGEVHVLVSWDNFEGKCELVKLLIEGRMAYDEIKVGIDPGSPHVVAIVGDREVIEVHRTSDVDEIKEIIFKVYKHYPYKHMIVRVGGGSGSLEIVRELSKMLRELPGLRLQIVDEKDTSRPPTRSTLRAARKDAAAVNIALRTGVEVEP